MTSMRLITGFVLSLTAVAGVAVVPPAEGPVQQKTFRHPDFDYRSVFVPIAKLPVEVSRGLGTDLGRLGVDPGNAYFDRRAGRWGTLIVTRPLIPGSGKGNTLRWSDFEIREPVDVRAREEAAWRAFRSFLGRHAVELRISPDELGEPRVSVVRDGLIQIHVGRRIDGIPVRNTFVKATLNSGNLVLLGQRNWGDPALQTQPEIPSARAEQALREHLGQITPAGFRKAPRLEIVPVSGQPDDAVVALGDGFDYRLVWVLTPAFAGDLGRWEALVDAHRGELLAFEDMNHYASRKVGGGIFPVSNDGAPPDGVEQPGYPMPFADVAVDGEFLGFASTGGNAPGGATGTISTALSGRYVSMNDNCGAIEEPSDAGDLDLGDGPGTDCEVPAGHSPGDTHASRSGFYELNRLIEQARGYLPGNPWLDQQLTANMNINNNCNAFWNGATVNFYTSGGGCANTGEIAAVFDHEWGHGMDHNDGDPTISRPGEGIADIYAQNRLNDSCVGRGFTPGSPCGGFGDPCLECTGVRESDWQKQQSGEPHDVAWVQASCVGSGNSPCGRSVHCEGSIIAEAAWDLVHRDLRGYESSPLNLDLNTALELGTRLSYYGSHNVGDWYQCVTDGTGGCNADSGYLGYLSTDDDNGDLTDGTPHMSAIFAAFDRHQIACNAPVVQNSGCVGGPATAPENVTAAPFHEGAQITWDPVDGASEYWIFRTEGVHGCDFGKAKVGETTGTAFAETGLRNDFEVLYSVVAVGESDACTGSMSACLGVTPEPGPGFGFVPGSFGFAETYGDGDGFFDNCESATLTFDVSNTGEGGLTDVRIVEVSIPSHPEASVSTELPSMIAASLPEGESAQGELAITGGGFEFNDTLEIQVGVTSDELAPITLYQTYTLTALQSDLSEIQESVTFDFEEGDDGWELVSGIFVRTDAGGGADGTSFYRASSSGLNLQCDRVRSPRLQLTETSTLELHNQYDIEGFDQSWWDRANVGVFEPSTGERTVVSPDDGRAYNASGTNAAPAPCASDDPPGQPGWAGAGPDWQPSTWSAAALGSPGLVDQLIQVDVAYGTDPAVTGDIGFWFDEVTVTDVFVQVPNAHNSCTDFAPAALTVDVAGNGIFEPGESVVVAPSWRNVGNLVGSLAGTGESFTGPASSSLYTIVDGGAEYGDFAPDEEVSCAATGDCYELSVFDASSRPAQHWDATFEEVTTSTGTEKAWTLHLGDSFADVPRESLFYAPVETLLHSGITGGCSDSAYCPAGRNTRAQMAAFLLRAVEGGDYTPPACVTGEERFHDVPADSLFCPWVEELAGRGVTSGCDGNNYCPGASVTRAQMAIFLLKALEGEDYAPPGCTEVFADVPCPSLFADWIEELATRGITSGCSGSEYCPATPVTRAQMASFVTKTFALTVYGP